MPPSPDPASPSWSPNSPSFKGTSPSHAPISPAPHSPPYRSPSPSLMAPIEFRSSPSPAPMDRIEHNLSELRACEQRYKDRYAVFAGGVCDPELLQEIELMVQELELMQQKFEVTIKREGKLVQEKLSRKLGNLIDDIDSLITAQRVGDKLFGPVDPKPDASLQEQIGRAVSDHAHAMASASAKNGFYVHYQVLDGDRDLGHISVSGELVPIKFTVDVTNAELDETDEAFKERLLKLVRDAPTFDEGDADQPETFSYHGGSITVSRPAKRARTD